MKQVCVAQLLWTSPSYLPTCRAIGSGWCPPAQELTVKPATMKVKWILGPSSRKAHCNCTQATFSNPRDTSNKAGIWGPVCLIPAYFLVAFDLKSFAQCCVAAWMGGEFGGEWMDTCICMVESLCCPSETITILLIGYTSIQNKKFLKKERGLMY